MPCRCNVVPPYDSTTVQFTLIHEEASRAGALSVMQDIFRMNQKQLEGAVRRMWGDKNLEPARKSYLMQHIMASRYIVAQQQHKLGVGSESADTAQQSGAFHRTHTDRCGIAVLFVACVPLQESLPPAASDSRLESFLLLFLHSSWYTLVKKSWA